MICRSTNQCQGRSGEGEETERRSGRSPSKIQSSFAVRVSHWTSAGGFAIHVIFRVTCCRPCRQIPAKIAQRGSPHAVMHLADQSQVRPFKCCLGLIECRILATMSLESAVAATESIMNRRICPLLCSGAVDRRARPVVCSIDACGDTTVGTPTQARNGYTSRWGCHLRPRGPSPHGGSVRGFAC